jgi:hypothetical protein
VPIQLDADLPAPLIPLAWLVGRWAGAGVAGYPTMTGDVRFGQEVSFTHDGRPFLSYASTTWLLDDDGRQVRPLASETGYWRPSTAQPGEHAQGPGSTRRRPTPQPAARRSRCCSRTPAAMSRSTTGPSTARA